MDDDKKRRLESAGWKVGTTEEFLGAGKTVNEWVDELEFARSTGQYYEFVEWMLEFARQEEREACAQVAKALSVDLDTAVDGLPIDSPNIDTLSCMAAAAEEVAKAIRARGGKDE